MRDSRNTAGRRRRAVDQRSHSGAAQILRPRSPAPSIGPKAIYNALASATGLDPVRGFRHPLRGGGTMMFPLGGRIPLKAYPSSVPGITMKRVAHGEYYLDETGARERLFRRPYANERTYKRFQKTRPSQGGEMPLVYNAVDAQGNIIGSIKTRMGRIEGDNSVKVPSVWIDPAFRKTKLFHDLARIPLATGRPIDADVVNPRLFDLLAKLARRDKRFSQWNPPPGYDSW